MRTTAPVIGVIADGSDHYRSIRVRCPLCGSSHVHAWRGGDDLGTYPSPCCAFGSYAAAFSWEQRIV